MNPSTLYFKEEKEGMPYTSVTEYMTDVFLMLDLLLEGVISERDLRISYDDWHVRGLRITEEEIDSYLETIPVERPEDTKVDYMLPEMEDAYRHIRSREDATKGIELPLRKITDTFDLSMEELIVLLMAASPGYDIKYLRIYNYLQKDGMGKLPDIGVVSTVLHMLYDYDIGRTERLLSPERNLSKYLIRIDMNGDTGLHYTLSISDTLYRYLVGEEDHLPAPLREIEENKELSGGAFFKGFLSDFSLKRDKKKNHAPCYIESTDREDVRYVLLMAAKKEKTGIYEIDITDVLGGQKNLKDVALFLRLHKGALLISTGDHRDDPKGLSEERIMLSHVVNYLLDHLTDTSVYICGEDRYPRLDLPAKNSPSILNLPLPDVMEREAIWEHMLKKLGLSMDASVDIFDIADCHEISFGQIQRIMLQAKHTLDRKGEKILSRTLLQDLLFRLNTSNFDYLATEVNAHYTWEDIYLEDAQKKRLKAACDRFRLRNRVGAEWGINKKNAYGNAVILLMYGPPGTGKTMAAQAIANEVMTPLYRVDVSQIFSKYIGETQKNLSRIFDEAQKRSVVLFFDEADALFTKRTEIKDSHDKYANSDTSFLLQKVEEYNGISILATNNYQSFDPAFMRRLTYVVHFERPDEDTRLKMWSHMLPEEVPMDVSVDFEWLAGHFTDLSGSNIKSILLTAAYFAGADKRKVHMKDIILATRYEFEKLGRLIDSDEFGQYALYMQE